MSSSSKNNHTTSSNTSSSSSNTTNIGHALKAGGLPPPPPAASSNNKLYAQSLKESMTMEEMRQLHKRAQSMASHKSMELRIVLASRYRELVGNSDQVIQMKERAYELHELVRQIPNLMDQLVVLDKNEEGKDQDQDSKNTSLHQTSLQDEQQLVILLRTLPRKIHRALDRNQVYEATTCLLRLFDIIQSNPNNSKALDGDDDHDENNKSTLLFRAQQRMIHLQMLPLPRKIFRLAQRNLQSMNQKDQVAAAAASLDALQLLEPLLVDNSDANSTSKNSKTSSLDKYLDSKTVLLKRVMEPLLSSSSNLHGEHDPDIPQAESILSQIIQILQYDIILHSYLIFHPQAAALQLQYKVSKFLATHLPLIQSKAKAVLVTIAGTTASALGRIRQSLYDQTDGNFHLKNNHPEWDTAVATVIDMNLILAHHHSTNSASAIYSSPTSYKKDSDDHRKFSLWGILFSQTFSSLVHSILTTSFQSVHSEVVSALRASIANAPSRLQDIQPHEAYRNTLRIASNLDRALIRLSDDAHELLVHAEEREESQRRLRSSLYVQTCEIMGRLLSELRRMVQKSKKTEQESTDTSVVKELIVGRLCYLLKFRLTSLSHLLNDDDDNDGLPITLGGRISALDLQSAFDLADDDEDGLISYAEAIGTVESAFSGTAFRGSEMLRETLLLQGEADEADISISFPELVLLCARGLKHSSAGAESAAGAIQLSLDYIIEESFARWAAAALVEQDECLERYMTSVVKDGSILSDADWAFTHNSSETSPRVTPILVSYFLDVASIFSKSAGPVDAMPPALTASEAKSLGLELSVGMLPSARDVLRSALLKHTQERIEGVAKKVDLSSKINDLCPLAASQLLVDLHFLRKILFEPNGTGGKSDFPSICKTLQRKCAMSKESADRATSYVRTASDLLLSPLLGTGQFAQISAGGELSAADGSISHSVIMFDQPVTSSRRFTSLPVQSDRSIQDLKSRTENSGDRNTTKSEENVGSGNFGLGFFSSMLKKK